MRSVLSRTLEWLYYGLAGIAAVLPSRWGFAAAGPLSRLKARVRPVQAPIRRAAVESAFPDRQTFVETVLRQSRRLETWEEIEALQYFLWTRRRVERRFRFRGLEHLDRALAAGRGAILMTGHYGLLCSGLVALGIRGYQLSYLSNNTPRDPGLSGPVRLHSRIKISGMKRRGGGRFIYLDLAQGSRAFTKPLRRMVRDLQAGQAVVVVLDVPPQLAAATADVQMLGRRCRFPVGIPWLAKVSGAPVLPFFAYRSGSLEEAVFEAEVSVSGDTVADLQRCVGVLERYILRDPAQWMSWEVWPHFTRDA